jgi:hypothetical protein
MNTDNEFVRALDATDLQDKLVALFNIANSRNVTADERIRVRDFTNFIYNLPGSPSKTEDKLVKEFWPPVDGITVVAFEALIKAHDFYYGYSDDNSVWRRGEEELKVIQGHIAKNPRLAIVWTNFCHAKDASSNAAIAASKATATPKSVSDYIAKMSNAPAVEPTVLEDWFFREPDSMPMGTLTTPVGMQIRFGEDGITSPIVSFDGSKKTVTTKSGNTYRLGYVLYTKCYCDRSVLSAVGF